MLNKPCLSCQKPLNGGVYRKPNMCPWCGELQDGSQSAAQRKSNSVTRSKIVADQPIMASVQEPAKQNAKPAAKLAPADQYKKIKLSKGESSDFEVASQLGSVKANCLFSLEKLMAKSPQNTRQTVLKSAQKSVLLSLRKEAHKLGANAVIKTEVKFKELSHKGEPKVQCIAFGEAVMANGL
ncbi:heavy metal-binding domain-containing protein [Agaribacterium sp. ZY112]|uniref:heavy metal-binding domain-containing protein n=1 Tax=Agaribacterium sp. ZY112 TaxID=3233574 RepID=UPI00352483E2